MTHGYGAGAMANDFSEKVLSNQEAQDCLIPMGITSENVATDFGISRAAQDEFAAKSFQKAAAAQKAGKFKDEIVPIKVKFIDPKTEKETEIVVDHDDGVRDGVTAQSLAKLKPAFIPTGSAHAGNASQVSDGAAAVLLARRSVAKRLGLPIIGKYVTSVVVGVPPRIMGVGPAYAIPKVLEKTGLSKEDIDFYEINEAFASQAIYSVQQIGIPFEKVNINGGAIAIGHPLGCSMFCLSLDMSLPDVSLSFSWCPADRDRFEHCQADWWQSVCNKYVHWIRHGHGRRICQRAVVLLPYSAVYIYSSV
jgi:acetyl-CoA acyltransferase 1